MDPTVLQDYLPLQMMIVDDDDFMAELIADHYREMGFEVVVAKEGKVALAQMEANLPDLVLCDRKMPEMSGADLLEIVRGRGEAWQRMAFVFVTGLSDHRDRFSMLPLHPDGYICKPIDFAKTDKELALILNRWQARLASPAAAGAAAS